MTTTDCLLGLGANLGDRTATLDTVVEELAATDGVELRAASAWRVSKAVGGPEGQDDFLNGAVLLAVRLSPAELMATIRSVESLHGRERRVRWAARTLDIDLLLFGEQTIDDSQLGLKLPHPRMSFRPFVIGPAAEVAPAMRHPRLDATLGELHERLLAGENRVAIVGGAPSGRDVVEVALRELAGPFDVLASGEPAGSPKLQICLDRHTQPLSGTPALWLSSEDPERWEAELAAAIECVWPS